MSKLTGKQERFIVEYLIDFNATQAAIRAGYSKRTARSQGQRLLTFVDIQKALAEKSKKVIEQVESEAIKVVELHNAIAFADSTKTYEKGVSLSPDELPEEIRQAVKDFQPYDRTDGSTFWKYTFWDKGKHSDALSKYHGLYEKDNEQKGTDLRNYIDAISVKAQEILTSLGVSSDSSNGEDK